MKGVLNKSFREWPGGLVIGVTGGIASGKSEVGRILTDNGVDVCDTDAVAHAMIEPTGPAYDDVIRQFGRDIVGGDGHIDRGRLGERVFGDATERERLNRIVHPHVRRAWTAWVARTRERNRVGALLIPLLFEVGAEKDVDTVWCVTAPEEQIYERLAQRGLTREQARARIASQMPLAEKVRRADYVLENNDTRKTLKEETQKLLETVLGRR